MFASLIKRIVGNWNDRQLKRMSSLIKQINLLEDTLINLNDNELKAKTQELKNRFQNNHSLDSMLPEAFAVVREGSKRCMNMRHFDVQLIGGITLHEGRIAEMRTGEGKTLMGTLPVYLNALTKKGVHVVTVNDYLAKRDANWMRVLYEFLGLSVGVVISQQSPEEKRAAYTADITYGTNNEFGFDYLRDNMTFRKEDKFQRPLHFAVIDEVDSILIDESRTPLIISCPAEDSSELYKQMNKLAPKLIRQKGELKEGEEPTSHYLVNEKTRQIEFTEVGHLFIEEQLQNMKLLPAMESLYSAHNLNMLHHVNAALKAHVLFTRNIEYIVLEGEILLIDEHTGRIMPGRRLSDGLHQALEAKENLNIQAESQTLASTTFQNYFRLYEKLSGMTGTADTEAFELRQIYGLDVIVIPTHQLMIRDDANDLVYLSIEEKYEAIIADIKASVANNRPVLVGTVSIESSEFLSKILNKLNISHNVLNAKFHEKEAEIISQAGRPRAITIATNMAGRGTDIILGGNWEAELKALVNPTKKEEKKIKSEWEKQHTAVLKAGGLHIIGTERHESRRIDNQLRGRAGRQGDPGSSRFYLSLEDNLIRIFASDRIKKFMKALGMVKGEAIEHRMVTNAIEKAQRKVENHHFETRKQLLEYDDVINDQRKVIYHQRNELLNSNNIFSRIDSMRAEVVNDVMLQYIPPKSLEEQWDIKGLEETLFSKLAIRLPIEKWLDEHNQLAEKSLREKILEAVTSHYQQKEGLDNFEKHILLRVLDNKWKEHLATMNYLRQGIHLRGYAQKNPKQEYKREAFVLFQKMLVEIKTDTIHILSNIQVQQNNRIKKLENKYHQTMLQHTEAVNRQNTLEEKHDKDFFTLYNEPFVRDSRKIGRNEPCPCGSNKKFKQCHGKIF